jgi:predicted permease
VAALGIGAATAAYTITDHVLLKPLPFPEQNRLLKIWEDMSPGGYDRMEPSPANYRDWKRMSHAFEAMAASRPLEMSLVGVGRPEYLKGSSVTADLLPMLGVQPYLGRIFAPADDTPGAEATVLLGYAFWKQRFGGQDNVVGRRILLDGAPYTVLGVLQKDFSYPTRDLQIWTAMRFANRDFEDRNNNYLNVLGKLRAGVTIAQARAEMAAISQRLRHEYPKDNEHVGVSLLRLRDEISERSRLMINALLGAALCVLLIACTNLANVQLARALVRRPEVDLRKALGAGRDRLVRQMMTENSVIALAGGLFGVLLATGAMPLFVKLVPTSLPIAEMPSIDWRVLVFASAMTILTAILFGVLPAVRAAGQREIVVRRVSRKEVLRSSLVVAEIAICFALLICSGLLIRALWTLQKEDPGFKVDHLLTMRTALPTPKYASSAKRIEFYDLVLADIRQLPGVKAAAYTSFLPIVVQGGIWPVSLPGQPVRVDRTFDAASLRFITPDYCKAMGVPLLQGRNLSQADGPTSLIVALVSESFVHRYYPHDNPIGRQFTFGFLTRTIVGVVGNVRVRGLERTSEPQVYLPYRQQTPDGYLPWYAPKDLAIRYSGSGTGLVSQVRRIIAAADPEQPVSDIQTASEIIEGETASRTTQVWALVSFAAVAVLLAGFGIYGLLSFTVSSRLREISVRMAVGAKAWDILRMVLGGSLRLALLGSLAGIILGYASGRSLESLLAGVHAGDFITYGVGGALVISMTLLGSFVPAFRAVHVDPVIALRSE